MSSSVGLRRRNADRFATVYCCRTGPPTNWVERQTMQLPPSPFGVKSQILFPLAKVSQIHHRYYCTVQEFFDLEFWKTRPAEKSRKPFFPTCAKKPKTHPTNPPKKKKTGRKKVCLVVVEQGGSHLRALFRVCKGDWSRDERWQRRWRRWRRRQRRISPLFWSHSQHPNDDESHLPRYLGSGSFPLPFPRQSGSRQIAGGHRTHRETLTDDSI